MYHGITVEHSYNCMVLLCRLFLGLSGHYTNLLALFSVSTIKSPSYTLTPGTWVDALEINIPVPNGSKLFDVQIIHSGHGAVFCFGISFSDNGFVQIYLGNSSRTETVTAQVSLKARFIKKL